MRSSKLTLKLLRWLIPRLSLPLLVLNGWLLLLLIDYFNTPLRILIVGAVIAFLLERPLQWLERSGVKRGPATLIIVAIALGLLGLLGITLFTILAQQARDLTTNFPIWEKSANQQFRSLHKTIGITLVTLLLAFKNIGLGLKILAIATVVDQLVENGIAPRLMGHLTGVHPVWVVVAILIGGKIAGILGVVLAVPTASTLKDVMEIYKPKRLDSEIELTLN
jgi:predicted PurR-regulated permease PerM